MLCWLVRRVDGGDRSCAGVGKKVVRGQVELFMWTRSLLKTKG